MGNDSILESTIASLRLKDADDLTWDAVTADLIQEWKRLKQGNPDKSLHSPRKQKHADRRQGNRENEKTNLSLKAERSSQQCTFCGKSGHCCSECFLNPESSKCRLPEQAQKSLKGLKTHTSKPKQSSGSDGNKIHFASLLVLSKRRNARRARQRKAKKVYLDSGASVTMFESKKQALSGSYSEGSNDTVQLAVGDDQAKCLGHGTLALEALQIEKCMHVEDLNDSLVSVGQICDQKCMIVFTAEQA
eukprot:IDg23796t1